MSLSPIKTQVSTLSKVVFFFKIYVQGYRKTGKALVFRVTEVPKQDSEEGPLKHYINYLRTKVIQIRKTKIKHAISQSTVLFFLLENIFEIADFLRLSGLYYKIPQKLLF